MILVVTFGQRLSACEVLGRFREVRIYSFTTPDDISSLFAKQIKNCTLAKILIKSR